MALESVANAILGFVNWGIAIVTIMAIWEAIAWATGYGTGGRTEKGVSEFGQRLQKWVGEKVNTGKPRLKEETKTHRAAAREKTAALNEFYEDKKELGLIKDARKKLAELEKTVNSASTGGIADKASFPTAYEAVQKAIEAAEKETRRLKSRTFRQERRSAQLIEALEDAGADKKDLNNLRSLESNLLKKHDEVSKSVEVALDSVGKSGAVGSEAVVIVDGIKAYAKTKKKWPMPTTVVLKKESLANRLTAVKTNLASVNTALDNAEKQQTEAYKDIEGLISKFRELWD